MPAADRDHLPRFLKRPYSLFYHRNISDDYSRYTRLSIVSAHTYAEIGFGPT